MVHRRARLPVHDRALREQRGDLRHGRERREEEREEEDAAAGEEGDGRVVEPEEDGAHDDRLEDEGGELDDLRCDAAADDLYAAAHECAGLHRDRDDVGALLGCMPRVLVLDGLLVVRHALGLADELGVVRGDVLAVEAREVGFVEVVDELGRRARDAVLVPLANDAAVRVRD